MGMMINSDERVGVILIIEGWVQDSDGFVSR